MNDIIAKFDIFLEQKFGADSDSNIFRTYLVEIENTGSIDFIELDSLQYFTDNLFTTYHIEYPDSIWFDDSLLNIKYPSLPVEVTRVPPAPDVEKENNLINKLYKVPDISIADISSYFLALDSIKNNDTLIAKYLETRKSVGEIHPGLMVGATLMYFDIESEYFLKRMFIMELLEQEKLWLLTNGHSHLTSPISLGRRKIKHKYDLDN